MRRQKRRTKVAYAALYTDRTRLDLGHGTAEVTLFPNGERELWIKDNRPGFGGGFRLILSSGPHGVGIRVSAFAGSPGITLFREGEGFNEVRDFEACVYRETPEARAFRRWYAHKETVEDVALLGPEYDRAGILADLPAGEGQTES